MRSNCTYAIDVETYKRGEDNYYYPTLDTSSFVVGGVYSEKGYKEFRKREDMVGDIVDKIEKNRKERRVSFFYGHFINYDFYSIFESMIEESMVVKVKEGYGIKISCLNPFIATYGRLNKDLNLETREAYFIDSYSIFKSSLKELGEKLGLEKLELKQKIKKIDELSEYLERDCKIVYQLIIDLKLFLRSLGMNPKRILTAGNLAITCFLTYARKNNLHWIFSSGGTTFKSKMNKEVRKAFRGARIECFRNGAFKDVLKIDVRSLYPFIMKNMDFPKLNKEIIVRGDFTENYLDYIGVINCIVKVPEGLDYNYLPIRYNGTSYFPGDKILEGTWTTLEIREAIKLGYKVIKYKWGVFYKTASQNPLNGFINMLWETRKNTTSEIENMICKIIMNSLYGKFSQMRDSVDYIKVRRGDAEKVMRDERYIWEVIDSKGSYYILSKKEKNSIGKEPRYANAMISIWITALARDYMYKEMKKVPIEKMIYISTDCLMIRENIEEARKLGLNIGEELGQFKIEGTGDLIMIGENRYKFGEDIKIGGTKKENRTLENLQGKKFKMKKMVTLGEIISGRRKEKLGSFYIEEKSISSRIKKDAMLPKLIIDDKEK